MFSSGASDPFDPAGVPSREGRKAPQQTDWQRYRDRDRIERMFNRLKQMRRIATRYDKTALSFVSFLSLAAARH
nr:transposase [Asaia bogorensis]